MREVRLELRYLRRILSLFEDLEFGRLEWEDGSTVVGTTRQPTRVEYCTSILGGLVSRMRLTTGVKLPSDTPLHIICGSRDVIHS